MKHLNGPSVGGSKASFFGEDIDREVLSKILAPGDPQAIATKLGFRLPGCTCELVRGPKANQRRGSWAAWTFDIDCTHHGERVTS